MVFFAWFFERKTHGQEKGKGSEREEDEEDHQEEGHQEERYRGSADALDEEVGHARGGGLLKKNRSQRRTGGSPSPLFYF